MLAKELKHLRALLRLTQDQAAALCGVSLTVYSNMERGVSKITPAVSNAIEIEAERSQIVPVDLTPKQLSTAHLLRFRKHFGLTQARASELLGVTRHTWMRWESEQTPIPLYLFHTLRGAALWLQSQNLKKEEGE